MANATPQTRLPPARHHLRDGQSTFVAIDLAETISFWEITVKPPAMDLGDPVDQTTMWNSARRTQAPRNLYSLGNVEIECAYNPKVYDEILALIGIVRAISVEFSNHDQVTDWGWLNTFDPQPAAEGEMPRATVTICFGGEDPYPHGCWQESVPVWTDFDTGTCW
jgi:hypothetical protein